MTEFVDVVADLSKATAEQVMELHARFSALEWMVQEQEVEIQTLGSRCDDLEEIVENLGGSDD